MTKKGTPLEAGFPQENSKNSSGNARTSCHLCECCFGFETINSLVLEEKLCILVCKSTKLKLERAILGTEQCKYA